MQPWKARGDEAPSRWRSRVPLQWRGSSGCLASCACSSIQTPLPDLSRALVDSHVAEGAAAKRRDEQDLKRRRDEQDAEQPIE